RLAAWDGARRPVAEGDRAQAVAASRRQVADRDRDSLGDVGLAPLGGSEAHRRRRVEHEPGDQDALGEVDAYVRLAGPRGDVPVDLPDVVSRLVLPDLRKLRSLAEDRRPVV